ncbi:MAG: transposase [Pseudomonadota bacterium]
MRRTPKLYNALIRLLTPSPWRDKRHLLSLAWMVVGLILSAKISLGEWTAFVSGRARFAQSHERRFKRWLYNERIEALALYTPVIQNALLDWDEPKIYVALDTSMLWNTYCLIRLSVIYRGRAIPLVWEVIEHPSSAVALDRYKGLLQTAHRLLAPRLEVVFLADRGFVDTELMEYLSQDLGWRFRIRLKKGIVLYRQGARKWRKLTVRAAHGHARFYHNIWISQEFLGPVHLAFARLRGSRETWLIVSDEPTAMKTFEEYALRFDIEENFLDDKSNGFQLESSQIRDPAALTWLCLVLAIATLFLISQGTEVVKKGRRRCVDPHWFRGLSYLKIGWRWVRQASVKGYRLIRRFSLCGNTDPEPARSSRKYKPASSIASKFREHYEIFPLDCQPVCD